ncbi:MAG TPA: hypothetical protein IAB12_03110 [Candidatus Ornithospirochaeta avicola]|uniref:TraX protein n=1 Tax=Candidatus Ornithospirochaeta avicola TaxID=2840896 RepID=A0A9D1PTU4_9SPIO|nr:hypothetical protein [Candidatus Ornithospirochaeta avicola]
MQKEILLLFLIPVSYFILRTILYTETQSEHMTGTLSIRLVALLVFTFKKTDEKGKDLIPKLVFYAYYPAHLAVIYFLSL